MLLGTQVWSCRAGAAAIEFCRQLNIPAYMNGAARGTFAPGDPHHFHQTRGYAFEKADTIVIVGTPFDFRMGYGRRLRADATVVQIDLDYRTVGKNRDISLGIVGDAGAILSAATQAASGRVDNGARRRDAWLSELREQENKSCRGDAPAAALRREPDPSAAPGARDQPVPDRKHDLHRRRRRRGHLLGRRDSAARRRATGWIPDRSARLGVGTPFAMAAKLARPEKEVVCLFGDGAFGLTGWDFETCVRYGLPFIGVVGNNSHMNQIRYGQTAKYGKARGEVANYLGDVHFEQFAKMLGGYGEEVREAKDIGPALRRARESGKCALINVWIDP